MKHVQACLSAIEDREISFYQCGSSVNLVQACVWAGNTLQRHFSRRGNGLKHVQACLSTSKDGLCSFHQFGGPVKLVQACL